MHTYIKNNKRVPSVKFAVVSFGIYNGLKILKR